MAISEDNIRINVDLDKDVLRSFDQIKDELDTTRSNLIKNLILVSLHDLKLMKYTGIAAVSLAIKKAIERVSNFKFEGHPLNKSENLETIVVTIDKDTKAVLDKYAEELELPIKKLARNLIYTALDDYNFLKKTGLLKVAYKFRRYLEIEEEVEERFE